MYRNDMNTWRKQLGYPIFDVVVIFVILFEEPRGITMKNLIYIGL